MSNYPQDYISFSQYVMQTSGDKVNAWAQGEGELSDACRKIIDASQEKG